MTKIIASFALGLLFLVPTYTHAQTLTEAERDSLILQIMEQLTDILAQLAEIRAEEADTNNEVVSVGGDVEEVEEVVVEEFDVNVSVTVTDRTTEENRAAVEYEVTGEYSYIYFEILRENGSIAVQGADKSDSSWSGDSSLSYGEYTWKLTAYKGGGYKDGVASLGWANWSDKIEKTGSFTVSE